MKKLILSLFIVAVLCAGWWILNKQGGDTNSDPAEGNSPSFNTKQHSLEDPASPWVIVNKRRPLQPADYKPADLVAPDVALRLSPETPEMLLRAEAAAAVKEMFTAARADGLELLVASAFRSYEYQKGLYNTYVRTQGQATADTQSARPGFSEHQTGWAVDVGPVSRECEIESCFGNLPEGEWIAQNAHTYGFIIRYPEDKQEITGYIYEPWHLRYVGKPLAAELHKRGSPLLENFFELGAAPDYSSDPSER